MSFELSNRTSSHQYPCIPQKCFPLNYFFASDEDNRLQMNDADDADAGDDGGGDDGDTEEEG